MIHYTCDRCRKVIDPDNESRYEVRIEVTPADDITEDFEIENPEERDHLLELHNKLEHELIEGDSSMFADEDEETIEDGEQQERRYDLCEECFAAYAKNPIGRDVHVQLGFSQN